jgi:enoyl-CoA hydratase
MSHEHLQYSLDDGVATITIDDGKRNALPPPLIDALYAAFDRAEADDATVILTGRESVFSAGFDLNVMKRGGKNAIRMLWSGYGLTARVLEYPHPVIAACNGHCYAMGVFLMLAADHVIGTRGDFRVSANEVAIGLTMPRVAAQMLEHRLTPSAYQRAVTLAYAFSPDEALAAGFFDELADEAQLSNIAHERASSCKELPAETHAVSKRRIRKRTIRKIRRKRPLDIFDAAMMGLRGVKPRR